MKEMTLEHVAEACHGRLVASDGAEKTPVVGGVTDNRQVEAGNLFFAIVGEKTDGHKYVNAALEAGASAAIVEHDIEDAAGPYIVVESTEKALAEIAGYYRSLFEIPVVGITGSVGKTSTKEMIASVLGQKFNVLKTAGNFNNEIGMPLTLLRVRPEHQVAVVEMGINHFGEMDRMAQVARPDLFVMTNIGECHLEFLGDRDGVLKAKTEGLKYMPKDAPLILNHEDDKLSLLDTLTDVNPIYFGFGPEDNEIYVDDYESLGEDGSDIVLHLGDAEEIPVHVPVPGRHMVLNAMAGACVGHQLGLSLQEIAAGIQAMQTIAGRSNFIDMDGITVIDDCYNANPASMKASLEVLSSCKGQRRIAVLGDMGELGKDERALHYEVGHYAGDLQLDAIFFSGNLAQEISRGAGDNGASNLFYFADKDIMTSTLVKYVKPGDVVLVKASHFMGFDSVVEALRNR